MSVTLATAAGASYSQMCIRRPVGGVVRAGASRSRIILSCYL
jgi:hypothetical protein